MIALWLALASAHPLSPSSLRLEAGPDGVWATWRTPTVQPVGQQVDPVLPCAPAGDPVVTRDGEALELRWRLDCAGLAGRTAGASGLAPGGTQAVLQWTEAGGEGTALLTADQPTRVVPAAPGRADAFLAAFSLGVAHLAGGLDHVLFVFGLALLVAGRRLVAAITAFTAGHAVSLGLAGLGAVALPSAAVEVAIAASLVWLALEVAEPERRGWLARWPVVVCGPVGLVHGLGFAQAWRDSGLADRGVVGALLGFNLGIEAAQLGVLVAWLAVVRGIGEPSARARGALAWIGGAVAAMWLWERALGPVLQ